MGLRGVGCGGKGGVCDGCEFVCVGAANGVLRSQQVKFVFRDVGEIYMCVCASVHMDGCACVGVGVGVVGCWVWVLMCWWIKGGLDVYGWGCGKRRNDRSCSYYLVHSRR